MTHTSGPLTTGLPMIGNGAGDAAVGAMQGNTTKFVSYAGTACGGGVSNLTVKADGSLVGASSSISFLTAAGSTITAVNDGVNNNVTIAPDSSYLSTRVAAQAGSDTYCVTASASPINYACTQPATLPAYADGMRVLWKPDVGCTGGTSTTLNIDRIAAKRIYQNDGSTDPTSSQCAAGSQLLLAYTAALNAASGGWRILSDGSSGGGGTKTNPNEVWSSVAFVSVGNGASGLWNNNSFGSYDAYGSSNLAGLSLYKASQGAVWTYLQIPTNWTGTFTVRPYYTLTGSGTGSVNITVDTYCFTPPVTLTTAFAYSTLGTISQTFASGDAATGKSVTVTGSPASCSAGQVMSVRFQRQNSGTAVDNSTIFGAYFSLPTHSKP